MINSARDEKAAGLGKSHKRRSSHSKLLEGSEIMHLNIFEELSKPSPQNSDGEKFKFKSNSIVKDSVRNSKRIRNMLQSPPFNFQYDDYIYINDQKLRNQQNELLHRHQPKMSSIEDTNEENVSSDDDAKEKKLPGNKGLNESVCAHVKAKSIENTESKEDRKISVRNQQEEQQSSESNAEDRPQGQRQSSPSPPEYGPFQQSEELNSIANFMLHIDPLRTSNNESLAE